MRIRNVGSLFVGLVAVMLAGGMASAEGTAAAGADGWYSVATSDSEVAFVKTSSIKLVGTSVEVRVKENFTAPKPAAKQGKTFQSARTVYRLDCAQRKIAMSEQKFFSGTDLKGDVVGKASRNDRNLIWTAAPTASVFGEILDYGCRHAPTAAPAS